jgi:hypothetical protein
MLDQQFFFVIYRVREGNLSAWGVKCFSHFFPCAQARRTDGARESAKVRKIKGRRINGLQGSELIRGVLELRKILVFRVPHPFLQRSGPSGLRDGISEANIHLKEIDSVIWNGASFLRPCRTKGWNRKLAASSLNSSYRALLYKVKRGGRPPKRGLASKIQAVTLEGSREIWNHVPREPGYSREGERKWKISAI